MNGGKRGHYKFADISTISSCSLQVNSIRMLMMNLLHAVLFFMLLSSSDISKITFSKKSFRNTIRVSKCLDHDQIRTDILFVLIWSKLFAKVINRQQSERFKLTESGMLTD